MATLTYQKAPLVNKGDNTLTMSENKRRNSKITSAQYNKLAQAFNDRINGGAGDVAWRIWWYAHSLVRNIRMPADENVFPQTDEWWKLFGLVNPPNYAWPRDGGAGEPEGANLSNPYAMFVFGRDRSNVKSEATRMKMDNLSDPATCTYAGNSLVDLLKIWNKAKDQRGIVDFDGYHEISSNAVYAKIRQLGELEYAQLSPFLKSYCSYRPTPLMISPCSANQYAPKYNLRFEPLIENLPSLEFPACPGESGNVQYIHRGASAYTLFIQDSEPVVLPYNEYLETGTQGGGTFYKVRGEQFDQMLNNLIGDARGTEAKVKLNQYDITQTGFNFEKFFKCQFRLFPAIGSTGPLESDSTKSGVGEDLRSYPVFRIDADTRNQAEEGEDEKYLASNPSSTPIEFKVGDFLDRYNFSGIRPAPTENDLPGLYAITDALRAKLKLTENYLDFEKLGCLGGYLISHQGLAQDVEINLFEYTLDDQGTETKDAPVSIFKNGQPYTLPSGYNDGTKPYNILVYFDSPSRPARVRVKITSIGTGTTVYFSDKKGYIHVELLQQGYYLPDILDAYGIIRLSTTNGEASAFDNMLNFNIEKYSGYFEDYYNYGVIQNSVDQIGDSEQYISINSVYESTRKFLIDNLRLLDRKNLTGYKVENGDSVLYFRRTLQDIAGAQDPGYNSNLTLMSSNAIGQLYNVEATNSIVATGKYIVTLKGQPIWRSGQYTIVGQPTRVSGIPPADPTIDFAIYANASYPVFSTITGKAPSSFTFGTSHVVPFPVPNSLIDTNTTVITKNALNKKILVRWTSWDNIAGLPQFNPVFSLLTDLSGKATNGFTYELYRRATKGGKVTATLIASGSSAKTYGTTMYTTDKGVVHGGFYFEDAYYPDDNTTVQYEIIQTPELHINSTKVIVLPKTQLYPAAFSFTYTHTDDCYRVTRIEKKDKEIIAETVLISDFKGSTFYDTYAFDYATKTGVTFSHKIEKKTGNGDYAKIDTVYSEYAAKVWYDTNNRPYVSDFVPPGALVEGTAGSQVVITYKVDGPAGGSIQYAERDWDAANFPFVSITKNVDELFTWGQSKQDAVQWALVNVNKNFSKSATTVQVYIKSIVVDDTPWLERKIIQGGSNYALDATINVTAGMQQGTTYSLNTGKERLALNLGTGIEAGKSYLVKTGSASSFATYNNTSYADGESFIGLANTPNFSVSDASVSVYLVGLFSTLPDFDLFDGIRGPVVTPIKNGDTALDSSSLLRKSNSGTDTITYKVYSTDNQTAEISYKDAAGVTQTVANGNTFTWADKYTEYKWKSGNPYVVQEEGIVIKAPQNSQANQWSMFTSFAHYSSADSSIWKPDAYSDQLPVLHNRCHVNSFVLGSNLFSKDYGHLQKHFAYGQKPVMISEASPGYTYLEGMIGNNAGRDFYKSCQIYTPPYQIKSVKLLRANDTSDAWALTVDQIVITLPGRMQHGPIVAEFAKAHVIEEKSAIAARLDSRLAGDTYRTDENGILEYLRWFISGGYSHATWKDATNCRKGITGDQAPDGDVYHWSDDPWGCCFPRFYLIRNVRKVYEDNPVNDEVNFYSYPDQPIDSPMIAYDFRVMEFYLRAMCGGFLNLAASRSSATCDPGYEDSPFADYTFEDLCYQAMTPLLDTIECEITVNGEKNNATCIVTKDASTQNKFAPVSTEITYNFAIRVPPDKTPAALEQNLVTIQETEDSLIPYFGGWQEVPGNSFGKIVNNTYLFTTSNAFEGDTMLQSKFRIRYTDSTYSALLSSEETLHTLYFPFLAQNPNLAPEQQHTYKYRYRPWKKSGTNVVYGNWSAELPQDPTGLSTQGSGKKALPCIPGCTTYSENCLQLPVECDPYNTDWARNNADCGYCQLDVVNSPVVGEVNKEWHFALQYQIIDTNSVLSNYDASVQGHSYTLDWPTANSMEYDVYIKYHYKSIADSKTGASDWELLAKNVRAPYTVYENQLNLNPVKDVTDFIEAGDSAEIGTDKVKGGVASSFIEAYGYAIPTDVADFQRAQLTPGFSSSSPYILTSVVISPSYPGYGYGSVLTAGGNTGGFIDNTIQVISPYLLQNPAFAFDYVIDPNNVNYGKLNSVTPDSAHPGEFSSDSDCQLYLIHRNAISVLFMNIRPNEELKEGLTYIVCRVDTFANTTTEEIELGEWIAPKPINNAAFGTDIDFFEFIDTFNCSPQTTEMHWFLKKRTNIKINWHALESDSDTALEYKPAYNAYMRDLSKSESTTEPKNPIKLNSTALVYPTNNPYNVELTQPSISSVLPQYRKFFVQAEWNSLDGNPVSFKIQPRSKRRNRWFSPMPMTVRPDIPKGFGILPYTCAYAEMFDHYSNCINLLTKCRVDIPVTLQYRKTTTYTFDKNWQHLISPERDENPYRPKEKFPLTAAHIKKLTEQRGFPLIEQGEWTNLTQADYSFDLIAENFLGARIAGDIFIAKGKSYETVEYDDFLKCTSRQKLELRILPSEALFAVPSIIRPLVDLQKTLMLVSQHDVQVSHRIFDSGFLAFDSNALPDNTEIKSNTRTKSDQFGRLCITSKGNAALDGVPCQAGTQVVYEANDHAAAFSEVTITSNNSCNTVLAQSYTPLPIPQGDAIAMSVQYNSNPVQFAPIGTKAGWSTKTVAINSWLPYIEIPFRL